jgi:guanylate kinase
LIIPQNDAIVRLSIFQFRSSNCENCRVLTKRKKDRKTENEKKDKQRIENTKERINERQTDMALLFLL